MTGSMGPVPVTLGLFQILYEKIDKQYSCYEGFNIWLVHKPSLLQ